jgi:hypothetical protein
MEASIAPCSQPGTNRDERTLSRGAWTMGTTSSFDRVVGLKLGEARQGSRRRKAPWISGLALVGL